MKTLGWVPALERILCPLDVAQPTSSPLKLAGLIAERFSAALEVLYIGSNASSSGFGALHSNAAKVSELMSSHNAEQRLQELARSLKGSVPVTARHMLGAPAAAILEHASQPPVDLIVLGARQRSDLGWQFRDDVARSVAAMADCATLTVHDRDTHESIERILVAVDWGPATQRVLDWAGAFALRFGAEIQLLHVVSRERATVRTLDRGQNVVHSSGVPTDVSAALDEVTQRLVRQGVTAKSEVVVAGSVVNGITDYNDQAEFDLVVVGMSGPPQSPSRLTRGVVAALRNRMSVPILSVRATPVELAPGSRQRQASG